MLSVLGVVGGKIAGALWKSKKNGKLKTLIAALVVTLLGYMGISGELASLIAEIIAEMAVQ